jgi:uncharacterized protein YqgV (UPF0045/DUF77 family)
MTDHNPTIVADISMYPLRADYKPAIIAFIKALDDTPGMTRVTNQLSTQLRGPFDVVTGAIAAGMKAVMSRPDKVVFTVKYLNSDLEIERAPDLE